MILEDLCKYFISHRSGWYVCKGPVGCSTQKFVQCGFSSLYIVCVVLICFILQHVSEILGTPCSAYTGRWQKKVGRKCLGCDAPEPLLLEHSSFLGIKSEGLTSSLSQVRDLSLPDT